jgi:hypothetical protein
MNPRHRALHTKSLSESLARADLSEYSEVVEALKALEKEERGEQGLLSAIRPYAGKVVGRGQEAICFQLAPTSSLIRNQGFRDEVSEFVRNRDNVRGKILSDITNNEEDVDTRTLSVDEQVELVLESIPEKLVVKVVRPDGGSWDSSWGVREFDTPMYIWREITDGYFLVVQEELATESSMAALESQLGFEFEIVDPVGTLQDEETSLGTGQCGYNRFGKIALFDYSAIAGAGGYTDTLLRVATTGEAYLPDLENIYTLSALEQTRKEHSSRGLRDNDANTLNLQSTALSKDAGFWRDPLNRAVLKGILGESIDNRVPDQESLASIASFVALDLYADRPYNDVIEDITNRVDAVIEQALKDKLLNTL